jgi:hypothetical protein
MVHDRIIERAGGVWDPDTRRWVMRRKHLGPLIRALEAATDPPFRRAETSSD